MAYNTKQLEKQAIEVSLSTVGSFNQKFNNEKDFIKDLVPKLGYTIKLAFWINDV
jgi:hypothetical protein